MTEQQDFSPITSGEDDVEGHRLRLGNTVESQDEDDVEGHRMASIRNVGGFSSEDDDDVSGHMLKHGSTVEPSFDEDGLSER